MSKPAKRHKKRSLRTRLRAALAAGRPRKEGERYACGRLKPPKPNARVVAERTRLLGTDQGLERAEAPLDVALARGWIGEAHHRTAGQLRRLYARAGLEGPRLRGSLARGGVAEEREEATKPWSAMSDAELAAVFDAAFSLADPRVAALPALDTGAFDRLEAQADGSAAEALGAWRAANAAMTREERSAVFLAVIAEQWPLWVLERARGRLTAPAERQRDLLIAGLSKAGAALRNPAVSSPADPDVAMLPKARAFGPRRAETIHYVTPEGEQVLEVVRVKRRGQ
jgi:hypothetical protein